MTSERICPVCEKPVVLADGVYRVGETDYHPECYTKRRAEPTEPQPDRD